MELEIDGEQSCPKFGLVWFVTTRLRMGVSSEVHEEVPGPTAVSLITQDMLLRPEKQVLEYLGL